MGHVNGHPPGQHRAIVRRKFAGDPASSNPWPGIAEDRHKRKTARRYQPGYADRLAARKAEVPFKHRRR